MADSTKTPRQAVGPEQVPQQRVRVRMNEREMATHYANAFRSQSTAEEVMIDLGINTLVNVPAGATASGAGNGDGEAPGSEIHCDLSTRLVMNYYTAKRLALTLGNLVRQHEQQFGELKLNAADRTQAKGNGQ